MPKFLNRERRKIRAQLRELKRALNRDILEEIAAVEQKHYRLTGNPLYDRKFKYVLDRTHRVWLQEVARAFTRRPRRHRQAVAEPRPQPPSRPGASQPPGRRQRRPASRSRPAPTTDPDPAGGFGELWPGEEIEPLQLVVKHGTQWHIVCVNLAYAKDRRCWRGRA